MFFFIVSAKAPRRILGQFVVKKRGASTRINFFSLHVPEKYSKLCRTVIKKRDQCLYRRHCEKGALSQPHHQRTGDQQHANTKQHNPSQGSTWTTDEDHATRIVTKYQKYHCSFQRFSFQLFGLEARTD